MTVELVQEAGVCVKRCPDVAQWVIHALWFLCNMRIFCATWEIAFLKTCTQCRFSSHRTDSCREEQVITDQYGTTVMIALPCRSVLALSRIVHLLLERSLVQKTM